MNVLASHLAPYQHGRNAFQFTSACGDVQLGELKKLATDAPAGRHEGNPVIGSIVIIASWIVRIAGTQPIKESLRTGYKMKFEGLSLIQERGPLIISSEDGTLEITHISDLGQRVLSVRDEMDIENE